MTDKAVKPKNVQILIVGTFIYAFLLAAYLMTNSMLPDTAVFPRMIITLFAILNTFMVAQALRGKGEKSRVTLQEIKMPLIYFLGIVLYAILFSVTNYFVATAVMLVAYMLILKVRPYWVIPVITIAYSIFVYLLFVVWLNTSII